MELLIIALVFCAIPAIAANSRGRSPLAWFFISVLISPILGLILVLVLPNKRDEKTKMAELAAAKTCPQCAERIQPAANVCRYCRYQFGGLPAAS